MVTGGVSGKSPASGTGLARSANLMGGKKPTWWQLHALLPPKGAPAGPQLADQVVKLELADSISPETVRQVLKKMNSNHGRRRSLHTGGKRRLCGVYGRCAGPLCGTLRPQASSRQFRRTSKQLVAEKKTPIPPRRGRRERFDYEYKRNGTRNLFMCCEPLVGWRRWR